MSKKIITDKKMKKTKKVIFWVQQYRPKTEAISKEVKALSDFLKKKGYRVTIHDLHFKLKQKLKGDIKSYNFLFYPFAIPFINKISKKYDISHIFTSLGDVPYLRFLKKQSNQKLLITAAASASPKKIKKRLPKLRKLDQIIVETKKQKDLLMDFGINTVKIKIIYPGIDIKNFSYTKRKKKDNKDKRLKILFASSPPRKDKFSARGINLLLQLAKQLPENIDLLLIWRNTGLKKIKQMIVKNKLNNITLINKKIKNMNSIFSLADCTIIPYTKFDDFNKLMPNSIMESLAAGKPVLVSTKTEIKDIIKKNNCGVIFEPDIDSLKKAVRTMTKKYSSFQKNCKKTAKKHFSLENFLEEYKKIYK